MCKCTPEVKTPLCDAGQCPAPVQAEALVPETNKDHLPKFNKMAKKLVSFKSK